MKHAHAWCEHTTKEIQQAITAKQVIAFLPLGSTEAHGPHLPLSTDVIIAEQAAFLAAEACAARGWTAWVLPAQSYAVTDFAEGFVGSLSIKTATATALYVDIIASWFETVLQHASEATLVICSAHLEPEHILSIGRAVKQLKDAHPNWRLHFPDITKKPHALRLGEEFKSGACHAGEFESSLVLAASDEGMVNAAVRATLPEVPISLSRAIREGKKNFTEAGGAEAYFGSPAQASREKGERLYQELVEIFISEACSTLA